MPGLIEMHTHMSDDYGEPLGKLWLAYGVTSVREPAGNPYRAVERREAIESGTRAGPRIFTTGYTLDGSRIYYSGSNSIGTGPQLEREIEHLASLGLDVAKTYVRLPDPLQARAVEAAHARGLWVTSHEFYPAMAYGADGVEHIRGTSRRGYSPKVSSLNRSYSDFTGLLAGSGMTLTPTTGIQGTFQLMSARDATYLDDPRFRALYPGWIVESSLRAREQAVAGNLNVQAERLAGLGRTVREVVSRGGRVIAGTDAPIIPFAISLHAELEYYVMGGLTPFEALRTATSWAADALNADVGRVAPGMLADLVIVDGDPLRNIRDARKVRTVLRGGVVYSIEGLSRRLSVPRT
jgi:imidazolonepropionase-like amidohydrolase